jgi:hypothetical protein
MIFTVQRYVSGDPSMRKQIALRLALLTLLSAVPVAQASAGSIVLAQATLNWNAFAFSVSGGLSIDEVIYNSEWSNSFATTTQGGTQNNESFGGGTRASSGYLAAHGAAGAHAGADAGVLGSSSAAATYGSSPVANVGASGNLASTAFWLYGHGTGTLTVQVPYELRLAVETNGSKFDELNAEAEVSINLGPGAGWFASDSLSWANSGAPVDGLLLKTGFLVLSRDFSEPSWGPLVSMGAGTSTIAVAAVPEPSELVLFGLGIVSLAFVVVHTRRARARATHQV